MSEVLQESSATIFMDRRLLYVGVPGAQDEMSDAPRTGRHVAALPHGCLVTPIEAVDVVVRARVLSAPPALDVGAEVVSFDVVEGEVIITNPLWAGPPGQITLQVPDGRWSLAVTQTDAAGPLHLDLWADRDVSAPPAPIYRPAAAPREREREIVTTFREGTVDHLRLDNLAMMLDQRGFAGFGHVDYRFTHDSVGSIHCVVRSDLSEEKLRSLAAAVEAKLAYLPAELGARTTVVPKPT